MAENQTLLAHLAHKIVGGTENAAVESLAYILNNSNPAKAALKSLIEKAIGVSLKDCVKFETQVTAEDQSRPDFVGYDQDNEKRVIGEAKFWAALGEGQCKAYFKQLSTSGPAVLLFIVPDSRIDRLWSDAIEDVAKGEDGEEVAPNDAPPGVKSAKAVHSGKYLTIVSWTALLKVIREQRGTEPLVRADLNQLRGLVDLIVSEEPQPIRKEELSPEFPRLVLGLIRLVNDSLDKGITDKWIGPLGSRWSKSSDNASAGWYLKISGSEVAAWFGIDYNLWARPDCEDSPLWLMLYSLDPATLRRVSTMLQSMPTDETYFPLRLKIGSPYEDVLNGVVNQLKRFSDAIDSYGSRN